MANNGPFVVIVNGKGGVGKDTLVDDYILMFNERIGSDYAADKYSSVEVVKDIARRFGWNGNKDNKDRKFLSDLKDILTQYNDIPFKDCAQEYKYANLCCKIQFFFIREPDEIDKFKSYILGHGGKCVTLLVRRDTVVQSYGNHADDEVENYFYDYIFDNNRELPASKYLFRKMIDMIYKKEMGDAGNGLPKEKEVKA